MKKISVKMVIIQNQKKYSEFHLIIKQEKYEFVIYDENEDCINSPAYKILEVITDNLYKNNIVKNLEETNIYLE